MDPIRSWFQDVQNVKWLLREIGYSLRKLNCSCCSRDIEEQSCEVFSDVAKASLERSRDFKQGRSIRAWLMGFAVLVICGRCRNHRRPRSISETDLGSELDGYPGSYRPFESSLDETERRELIEELIHQLPPRDQKIIRLRFDKQLTTEMIASRLSKTPGNIRTLLHRALTRLRKRLDERRRERTP